MAKYSPNDCSIRWSTVSDVEDVLSRSRSTAGPLFPTCKVNSKGLNCPRHHLAVAAGDRAKIVHILFVPRVVGKAHARTCANK